MPLEPNLTAERTPPAPWYSHLLALLQNLGLAGIVAYAWLAKGAISSEVAMVFLGAMVVGVAVPALKPTGPNAAAAGAAGVLSSLIEGAVRSLRPPPPAAPAPAQKVDPVASVVFIGSEPPKDQP